MKYLIKEFLIDEINVHLFSQGIVEFSNSITKRTKETKIANEFLMDSQIIVSSTEIGYSFSKFILEITEQALSYDLNGSYEEKEYLLNKLLYLDYKLQKMVKDYLDNEYKSDHWTD
jgi:hypothetical protein